jgi:DNA-binding MarR family transcriptional regulator
VDEDAVRSVRRFNRTVTQRIGALNDEYLERGRPLGASRVLWELDEASDVRALRTRLDLDSGYLSRLLRALEQDRLVRVEPDRADKRVRTVRLTAAGRRERTLLDRQSDALAWSLLEPLNSEQRTTLVTAMETVARLLTAGLVEIAVEDPTTDAAQRCIGAYFAELDSRFDAGFDPALSITADASELVEPAGLLLLGRLRGEPVGCGALKFHGREPAEIKRMWVAPSARGLGVGRRILAELEAHARRRRVRVARLETNRSLDEAISLYRAAGYAEVDAFNDEPYAHHWFEKRLLP